MGLSGRKALGTPRSVRNLPSFQRSSVVETRRKSVDLHTFRLDAPCPIFKFPRKNFKDLVHLATCTVLLMLQNFVR